MIRFFKLFVEKKAECIKSKRERLLGELPNKNVRTALRRVPPSAEYFFGKENLQPLVQSLGGSQSIFNLVNYHLWIHQNIMTEAMHYGQVNEEVGRQKYKNFTSKKFSYEVESSGVWVNSRWLNYGSFEEYNGSVGNQMSKNI